MAEDRLPWRRSVSMVATKSDSVSSRSPAICLRPCQKASSRLTLVLCPAMTIDLFTTGDFIPDLPHRGGDLRYVGGLSLSGWPRRCARLSSAHVSADFPQRLQWPAAASPACGAVAD